MKISLTKSFSFPLDVVTQSVGILAKRRAGKSYTARRFSEQLHNAGQQICIIDPKGDWWGIRYASDGKGPGKPIFIFGGERGDIPLEVTGGALVAQLLVEKNVSVLLDLSAFRKREVAQFMTTFLEELYRLKARDQYRTPLMLVVDEADAIAPQKPQPEEARMLGAIEDIVRRGGQRGIGCTMITQRSAVLNKNVLTQIQVLMCLRTIAPQDLKAMDEWISVHGDMERRKKFMETLPALPIGDVWIWSPGWPSEDGYFTCIHVDPIETFDSGASPKPGEKKVAPRGIATVDLDVIRDQMAATIETAKANDPKELRKRILELEKQVKNQNSITPPLAEPVEINVLDKKLVERMEKLYSKMLTEADRHGKAMAMFWKDHQEVNEAMLKALQSVSKPTPVNKALPPRVVAKSITKPIVETSNGLSKCERAILTALAQYPQGRNRSQVALLSGYSKNSGSFANSLSSLRTSSFIEGSGDNLRITGSGEAILGNYTPLPTGDQLFDYWTQRVGKCEREILEVLKGTYPNGINRNEIAANTTSNYSVTSGSFANSLSYLRTMDLIRGTGNSIVLSDDLVS